MDKAELEGYESGGDTHHGSPGFDELIQANELMHDEEIVKAPPAPKIAPMSAVTSKPSGAVPTTLSSKRKITMIDQLASRAAEDRAVKEHLATENFSVKRSCLELEHEVAISEVKKKEVDAEQAWKTQEACP